MDSGIGSDIVYGERYGMGCVCVGALGGGGRKRNETWEVGRRDKAKCLAHEGYPAVIEAEQHVTPNKAAGWRGERIAV